MSPPDLEQDELDAGKFALEFVAGGDIQRRIFADDGVRAGAGLDGRYPRRIDQAGAAQPLGVLLGDEIIGDDGDVDAARRQNGISRSISAVLPEPTGPPMPTRAAPIRPRPAVQRLRYRSCIITSPQHVALRQRQLARRLAGSQFAIDIDVEGLRIDADLRTGIVPQHVALRRACACRAGRQQLLAESKLGLESALDGQRMNETADSAGAARPKAPHCGRINIGSQVISEAAESPMAPQAMKPPLMTSSGLMPKKAGRHTTISAILPSSSEPM